MCKGAWKIAKINLRNSRMAYFVAAITILAQLPQILVSMIISWSSGASSDNSGLSIGNILWIAPVIAAIVIPIRHFRKTVNLGGKRDNFLIGSLMVYTIFAFAGALANTVIHYTLDRLIQGSGVFGEDLFRGVMNVVEVFGWTGNGIIIAFLQQFAFLFFALTVIHTLVAMQDSLYGWVTDAVIAAVLGIMIPIAPLRTVLAAFFSITIFNANALIQIFAFLILGLAVYSLNKPIFARKPI